MKKSTKKDDVTDYIAEQMGYNPNNLDEAPPVDEPSILVPYAPIQPQYGEIKSIDEHGEEFINIYSDLYAVDRTSAVCLSEDKPRDWVLPGVRIGQVAFLVSPGGVGKSFWSLQAAYSIATGVDLCGFEAMGHTIKQGRVLYLSFEDDRIDLDSRTRKIFRQFDGLHNNNALHKMGRCITHAVRGGSINLMDKKSLKNYIKDLKFRLIIIDTLSQSHKGKENDNVEMAGLLQNLQDFTLENNVAVLVLHHASKASILGGEGDSSAAGRGASALNFNVRANFYMMTMTDRQAPHFYDPSMPGQPLERKKYVCWGSSKVNNSADMDGYWYKKTEGVLVPIKLMSTSDKPKTKAKKADLLDVKIDGDKYAE